MQALVAVPASSSAGIVEELLATAAASAQSETSKIRAIGVAADVLSLVSSGDVSLSKVSIVDGAVAGRIRLLTAAGNLLLLVANQGFTAISVYSLSCPCHSLTCLQRHD